MEGHSHTMKSLRKILDAMYEKFILRDVMGKCVPGILLLIVLSRMLGYCLEKGNTVVIVFAVFLSWCVGFLVQSFGEFIGLIQYYPKGKKEGQYENDRQWYNFYIEYQDAVKDDVKNADLVERFVVIKEMCGNIASALLLLGLVVVVYYPVKDPSIYDILIYVKNLSIYELSIYVKNLSVGGVLEVAFSTCIVLLFFRMHRVHVVRQAEYMKRVVDKKKSTYYAVKLQEAIAQEPEDSESFGKVAKKKALDIIGEAMKDIAKGQVKEAAKQIIELGKDLGPIIAKTVAYAFFKSMA